MGAEPDTLLAVHDVSKHFAGVRAVDRASLRVLDCTTHCVIGSNGAGKTTLFDVVSGATPPSSGRIVFNQEDLTGRGADHIARAGLVRTYQSPRAITSLSVLANVELAAAGRAAGYRVARLFGHRPSVTEQAHELLKLCRLDARRALPPELNHGARKRLELAMALACRPRLLLLDEPTAGMNAEETSEMAVILEALASHMTMVVIEHDLAFVRRMADRVTFMHRGRVLCDGSLSDVENDERVQRIYRGQEP